MHKLNNIKKMAFIAVATLAMTASIEGLLPPLYQTADEIRSVLSGKGLGEVLPDGEPIIEIRKNEQGYEVTTLRHRVQAVIVYKPTGRPGPAQFEVQYLPAEKIAGTESESQE